MGHALIVDVGTANNPGETLTEATAGSGSTFTVRNAAPTSRVELIDLWRDGAAAGEIQVTSPKLVPVSHGIQYGLAAELQAFLAPGPPFQLLTPQDQLAVKVTGGSSEHDNAALQSYYDELPGSDMVLKMPGDITGQTEFVFGWEVVTTASATIGNLGETVITHTYDASTANRWYAVLGYITAVELTAIGIKGVDTSQLFCGGPGSLRNEVTRSYFMDLSVRTGKPCIPLFNAANKANTNVGTANDAASTEANVTLILAQLVGSYQP